VGDLVVEAKQGFSFDANLSAKLKALEPKAKAQFAKTYNIKFTGKQLVGVVDLITR
jgi:hypothetical protein